LKECVVKDIIDQLPGPTPAYNTISSVIRVLETKGFVRHKAYGNSYVYYPAIEENDYRAFAFDKMYSTYFNNSSSHLVSFLVEEKNLTNEELEALTRLIKQYKTKRK
jgi:predicted transcriptional regulator